MTAFVILAWTLGVHAWPPTYGAEFEFGNAAMREKSLEGSGDAKTSIEQKEQLAFAKYMEHHCLIAKCVVKPIAGKWGTTDFVVAYEDGWWFKISKDPGCIEITFKPSSREELEARAQFINEEIFNSAKAVGLDVKQDDSAHFNIGIRSAFLDDGKKFLRFFVDYANHPDLALGSLGKDLNNGPPLSILTELQRQALASIVQETEQGKWKTIAEIAAQIQDRVYTKSYNPEWGGITHYQAIGLKIVNRTNLSRADAPMELRAIWSQLSAEHFTLIAKLMEGRIQYLNSLKTPIVYAGANQDSFSNSELLTRFSIYVREAGLSIDEFLPLLPQEVRKARLDDFIKPTIKLEKRLSRAGAYWDLILTSQLVRNYFVDIISDPQVIQTPEAQKYLQKLKTFVNDTPIQLPPTALTLRQKFNNLWGSFEKNNSPSPAPQIIVYQEILNSIEKSFTAKNAAGESLKVPAPLWSVRCEHAFLN